MNLIIAEKAIAAERIASLLADSKVSAKTDSGAQFFEFSRKGKPFTVIPLRGHVIDVDFPPHMSAWIGTDLKMLAKAEVKYVEREKKILSLLKKKAIESDEVIIATDADREGESIGLEAVNALRETNPEIKIKRALFSAIIKEDIEQSFSNLALLDFNLADSADARREIDLIWGAVLTRFLSIVSGKLGKEFLSAGRVQSPTLALVVDREKERNAFKSDPYFEVEAHFLKGSEKFIAQHKEGRILDKKRAEAISAKKPKKCAVQSVSSSRRTLKKPIPFNTTDFLRSATAIGFTAGMAMNIAETLYQKGLTSYPRTDNAVYPENLNIKKILSELSSVKEFFSIIEFLLSKKKLEPSRGKESKDHPPIHPVSAPKEQLSQNEWRIYELICRRFFATLADDAVTENLSVEIDVDSEPFVAHGQLFIQKGWKEFYPYSKATETILPEMRKGDLVDLEKLELLSKETQPPAHYSQGSLIQLMAENNLGTKSTRHDIIQKLYFRKYISGNKALVPNKIAFAVIDTLEQYSETVVRPKMTSELETEMDFIAAGKKSKPDVVNNSREFLLEILEELIKSKDKIGTSLRQALRESTVIGKCTREGCEGNLVMRKAGFSGKRFLGCSAYPKCTQTYPLPQKGDIEAIDEKCPECGKPLVKLSGKRFSLKMCVDFNCPSKDEWKKKQLEKEAAKNAKKT